MHDPSAHIDQLQRDHFRSTSIVYREIPGVRVREDPHILIGDLADPHFSIAHRADLESAVLVAVAFPIPQVDRFTHGQSGCERIEGHGRLTVAAGETGDRAGVRELGERAVASRCCIKLKGASTNTVLLCLDPDQSVGRYGEGVPDIGALVERSGTTGRCAYAGNYVL